MNTKNDISAIVKQIQAVAPDQVAWVVGDCVRDLDTEELLELHKQIQISRSSIYEYRRMATFWTSEARITVQRNYPTIMFSQMRAIMYVANSLEEALCLVKKVASKKWSPTRTRHLLRRWRPAKQRRRTVQPPIQNIADKPKKTPTCLTVECEVLDHAGLVYKLALYGNHQKLEQGKLYQISFTEVVP